MSGGEGIGGWDEEPAAPGAGEATGAPPRAPGGVIPPRRPGFLQGRPRQPAYFVPAGCAAPQHTRYRPEHFTLCAAGPGGSGGLIAGDSFRPAEAGEWQCSAEGWWVRLRGAGPAELLRLSRPWPGVRVLARDGSAWLVPRLLRPACRWHLEDGLQPAVHRVRADGTWAAPAELEGLVERLAAVTAVPAEDAAAVEDLRLEQLAAEVLGVHYHVAVAELGAGGWLDGDLIQEVLLAAVGMHPEDPEVRELRARRPVAGGA